jgi:hypothetical protein
MVVVNVLTAFLNIKPLLAIQGWATVFLDDEAKQAVWAVVRTRTIADWKVRILSVWSAFLQ